MTNRDEEEIAEVFSSEEEAQYDVSHPQYLGRVADRQREKLGSAQWSDPVDFAVRHQFEEGDFWLGRSPITNEPIGFSDDRHVLMASGTRSGKGTSVIINNLCSWQGSVVVLDPKGENASVTAARRGAGSDYCEGLGQAVHVLDPFQEASVDESLRSRYNPLDAINMDGVRFNDEVMRIVSAIIVKPDGSRDKFFDLSSQDLLRGLILHVKTSADFEGKRTLTSVRRMISHGEQETVELLKSNGVEGNICPFDMLWESMVQNPAGNGIIAGIGKRIQSVKLQAPETYQGIFQNCLTETMFLDSPAIQSVTEESDFQLSELKTNPDGVSLYLCLSLDDMEAYFKWLRIMITLTASAMIKTRGRPVTGYQTLMCLDEFASLQRMKLIEDAVAQLAGYGLKMFFIVQDFGQLKAVYKENWEVFVGNSGLKLIFGQNDHLFTLKYISDVLGETEVSRLTTTQTEARGKNQSQSEGSNESKSIAHQKGVTSGESETVTESKNWSKSKTRTKSVAKALGKTIQRSKNWNRSRGGGSSENWQRGSSKGSNEQAGRGLSQQYETGDFGFDEMFADWSLFRTDKTSTTNQHSSVGYSSQNNQSRGGGTQTNFNSSRGGGLTDGTSRTVTQTEGESIAETSGGGTSFARGTSVQRSESETLTRSEGTNRQRTEGESLTTTTGRNEILQARPLITVNELKKWFAPASERSIHYPGFSLVMISNEDPTAIRRANYYEDDHFLGWYDPHPDWPETAPPRFQFEVDVLGLPDWDVQGLEWLVEPETHVEKGQPIALLGPFPFDFKALYAADAFERARPEHVQVNLENEEFHWAVVAPRTGVLKERGLDPEAALLGTIATNQRLGVSDNETPEFLENEFLFEAFLNQVSDDINEQEQRAIDEKERLKREAEEAKERKQREEERLRAEEAKRKEEEELARLAEIEEAKRKEQVQRKIGLGIAAGLVLFIIIFLASQNKEQEEKQERQDKLDARLSDAQEAQRLEERKENEQKSNKPIGGIAWGDGTTYGNSNSLNLNTLNKFRNERLSEGGTQPAFGKSSNVDWLHFSKLVQGSETSSENSDLLAEKEGGTKAEKLFQKQKNLLGAYGIKGRQAEWIWHLITIGKNVEDTSSEVLQVLREFKSMPRYAKVKSLGYNGLYSESDVVSLVGQLMLISREIGEK